MTRTVIRLARCPVCQRMHAEGDGGPGCGDCVGRFGVKFVALSEKFRQDEAFRRAVLARMSPAMLDMLFDYFVDPPLIVPKGRRRGPFEL